LNVVQLQNILIRFDINSWIDNNTLWVYGEYQLALQKLVNQSTISSAYSDLELNKWKLYTKEDIHRKIYDAKLDGEFIGITDYPEKLKSILTEKEWSVTKFLVENNLIRDKIVSIIPIDSVELADISVPVGNTVVYNGIVGHNTLSYAVLYGAEVPRIRQSLASAGYYYSPEKCLQFQNNFFEKLPMVKKLIDETHKAVLNPGYISTVMGRKKFINLGPKYMRKEWEAKRQEANREATNFHFQSGGADAIKMAMIDTYNYFEANYEPEIRPKVLLNIHDELVHEARDEIIEEIEIPCQNILLEAGGRTIEFLLPLETSSLISKNWRH